jgi:putative membrane protein
MNPPAKQPIPFLRLGITGIFMGLANLVPGVSGGTMVLALGLYDDFIGAMSDISRLRLTPRAIIVLAMLFGGSALTILLLSSVIQAAMESFLPGMLALFIGMTLGGAPALFRDLGQPTAQKIGAMAAGFLVMAVIALVLKPGAIEATWPMLLIGGIVGSSAMILPGISGSYMLLVMGLYLPIIAAISDFRHALSARDFQQVWTIGWGTLTPVAVGLGIGIVGFSALLKFLLSRHHAPTIGFLLGLLLGSVLGLYPFKGPDFGKLGRYAVTMPNGNREVFIMAHGWDAVAGNRVYEALKAAETPGLKMRVIRSTNEPPTLTDIAAAREARAVVITYGQRPDREVRREAATKKAATLQLDGRARAVELQIIPDTAFSFPRAVVCVALIIVGFLVTFLLSRMEKGKGSGEPAPPTLAEA